MSISQLVSRSLVVAAVVEVEVAEGEADDRPVAVEVAVVAMEEVGECLLMSGAASLSVPLSSTCAWWCEGRVE